MASSSGKKNKAKPTRFTEFFHTNSAPPTGADKQKGLTPLSPSAPPMAESADTESQDTLTTMPNPEPSMQQILQTFRLQLQDDFKYMISEFKLVIQSLVSRMEHVEKKMAGFAKSNNTLIDSHSAISQSPGPRRPLQTQQHRDQRHPGVSNARVAKSIPFRLDGSYSTNLQFPEPYNRQDSSNP